MNLPDVYVFVQVVRSGSFTAAARELSIQKSTVSRKVAELEERLGVRLLHRTTRTLRLTDEGRIFYEHCTRALAELEEAELALSGMRAAPRGLLRVTAPLSFAFLGPILAGFLEAHPEVRVELVCTDRVVDLVEERFDVAIRVGHLPDTTLIARRLASLPHHLYASPGYLDLKGSPARPEDLAAHDCLVFGAGRPGWRLVSGDRQVDVRPQARLVVNDFDLLQEAAIVGGGIALLPAPACARAVDEGRLVRVLPEWTAAEAPVHALYAGSRHVAPKVTAFVDWIQRRMPPAG